MKKVIYIIIAIIIGCVIIASTAIDTSMENSVKVSGKVKLVYEGGVKDVVFVLENNKAVYYINRGFENGFNLAKAKKDFEGKKIKLFYAKSWTPLAPFGRRCKHITHAAVNDSVIFSEW
ncbi:hypothetical protein [Flavobacterium wongokense]|uniref:hypothetical protein n=1 Tax=Flavobacterium wongokense TaxID=2910674 RepID=UPI001F47CF38|nr:hypothetical protein [Flavobacterium sp. WG47]MCF6133003.1 hypothetical protein [Flavobacterium sp. WG47]